MGVIYRIEYLESVVRDDIPALPKEIRNRIRASIEGKLAHHPIEFGKPWRYILKSARRLLVGDWRVNFAIEPPDVVVILKIGHRREIHEG